ncbi:DUF6538 domain-containing protein [Neorhizobium sp. NCHU2750]|uniref:DUF6538 domain-containing protein n=1 Tax=Neorhizobium sp. NCHU2750 TaxID=1825976 RepID=UPI0013C4AF98
MNIATKAKPPKYVFLRGTTYYYIRNIAPQHRHRFSGKKQIWQTLKTSDYGDAIRRADAITREHDAVMAGIKPFTAISFTEEIAEADRLQITHITASELRLQSIERSIQLIAERLPFTHLMGAPAPITVAAILGESERDNDALSIDQAFEKFMEITPDFLTDLNEYHGGQKIKSWKRTMADFKARVGDINLTAITETIADDYFLSVWKDVLDKEKDFGSSHANRQISRVRQVIKAVLKKFYHINFPFLDGKRVKLKNDDAGKRDAFTEADVKAIQTALATSGVNEEAKAIVQLSLITGCGPQELCWLTADDIFPDAKIPYIKIGPNALRSVVKKGGDRHRDLPIVTPEGIAILKKFPNGFPRFQVERGQAKLNKQLSPFFTKVTPGRALYSARHRFDDLVKIAGVDLGIKAALSGHSLGGHLHYYGKSGNGYTLKQKKEAIEKALAAAPLKEERENEMN